MNILIIGNGFDLAHYLPTKYDHFMGAMQAIEDWNISDGDMNFDDLFKSFYAKEAWFFGYTKAMYKTDDIKLSVDEIEKLKIQLSENVWYQYFSNHVKELKTWIDFETKIEEALEVCCSLMDQSVKLKNSSGKFHKYINALSTSSDKGQGIYLNKKHINMMIFMKILRIKEVDKNSRFITPRTPHNLVNDIFIDNYFDDEELACSKIIIMLNENLNNLIKIFNTYLSDLAQKLNCKQEIVKLEAIESVDLLFSFNYTDTFYRLYQRNIPIDFIHGKSGDEQNIVLGISDLSHNILREFKAYGFVKYHQKLMNNTDYKFIHGNESINNSFSFWQQPRAHTQQEEIDNTVNLIFWGHSLDISDRSYIEEIFTLNDEKDLKVRVSIYFYDTQAKFSMLANLIHILGNQKVELWMKKGWLKFEPVPNIADINGLESVALQIL